MRAGRTRQQTRERVRKLIEMVGLRGFEHRYPHELSGGMRQRCALARMLANDPTMWLMDEPLAAVDLQTRMILQDELLRMWGDGAIGADRRSADRAVRHAWHRRGRAARRSRAGAGAAAGAHQGGGRRRIASAAASNALCAHAVPEGLGSTMRGRTGHHRGDALTIRPCRH